MPPVTATLIGVNVAIFLLQLAAPAFELVFALWPIGAGAAVGGPGFAPWQLVTYAFLHGSMVHLAFNMFALYMFGGAMERVFGGRRYLIYYFVCVISAALTILSRLPWAAFADEISEQAIATIEFLEVIHVILTL